LPPHTPKRKTLPAHLLQHHDRRTCSYRPRARTRRPNCVSRAARAHPPH
jgi:hypothetical protein